MLKGPIVNEIDEIHPAMLFVNVPETFKSPDSNGDMDILCYPY